MNESEVAQLLTIASGFDRRIVDRVTTTAWHQILATTEYQAAVDAVIAHQIGPLRDKYLTIAHIVDAVQVAKRQTPALIAADVRSARARGLVLPGWSERDPVPEDVQVKLAAARAAERSHQIAAVI